MNYHRVILTVMSLFLVLLFGLWAGRAIGQVNVDVGGLHVQVGEPQPSLEEIEVLTRGPIHEAFAQPVTFDEGAGFIIPHKPPAPILENVPYDKPEGDYIVWIPGYWGWDSDRNDFIWISGCWRAVPPGTSWVPGYWAQSRQGYQWIAGFWTTADTEEIVYLPAPPASLEEGPIGVGSIDGIWVPGNWIRYNGRYAWRPGFWESARPGWVWVPAQYIYTPRGYVYVRGYWDYSLDRRGVAFLPVYCPPSRYRRSGFRYSPNIALDLGGLLLNLFVSRSRHHYYFGDYYGDNYVREGYRPWYESRDHRDRYDPIFLHEQWRNRNDLQWSDRQRTEYERRLDNKDIRPARTYTDMRTRDARLPEKDRDRTPIARPMRDVVAKKTTPFQYEKLDKNRRKETSDRERDVRAYQDKRSRWESPFAKENADPKARRTIAPKVPARTDVKSPKQPAKQVTPVKKAQTPRRDVVVGKQPAGQKIQAQKVKVPRSPIVVRQPSRNKELTPPPKPKYPKINPNVQPNQGKAAPNLFRDKDKDKDKDKSKLQKK